TAGRAGCRGDGRRAAGIAGGWPRPARPARAAVIGAVTVLFTYLLARRLYGPAVGLSAAILLAAFHYHVFFSRVASLQVVDTLAIVAAPYWLDRGASRGDGRRRVSWPGMPWALLDKIG